MQLPRRLSAVCIIVERSSCLIASLLNTPRSGWIILLCSFGKVLSIPFSNHEYIRVQVNYQGEIYDGGRA